MQTDGKIKIEDQRFIQQILLPKFSIPVVRLSWSNSEKKWPDIWFTSGQDGIPTITVTAEWARQNTDERRKRLVHEFLHEKGMDHGVYNGLEYSTIPAKDKYSMAVYREIISRNNPKKKFIYDDPNYVPKNWTLADIYYNDLYERFPWHLIRKNLELRESDKGPESEYPSYHYLGNYLTFGPDTLRGEKQHYYEKIWFVPTAANMSKSGAAGYRLGMWFSALTKIADEFGLHIKMADEDPADIYVGLGKAKEPEHGFWLPTEKIEGF
jgi:hypothetical protein